MSKEPAIGKLHSVYEFFVFFVSFNSSNLSCPQAASMSLPKLLRTVAGIPRVSNSFRNCSAALRSIPRKDFSETGFNGIRFTWQSMPDKQSARRSALSAPSLTPRIRVYSKVTRLPVFSACRRQACSSSFIAYLRFTGISALRSSSQDACREIAKLTWGNSSPNVSICGTSPQVETVIALQDKFSPSSS